MTMFDMLERVLVGERRRRRRRRQQQKEEIRTKAPSILLFLVHLWTTVSFCCCTCRLITAAGPSSVSLLSSPTTTGSNSATIRQRRNFAATTIPTTAFWISLRGGGSRIDDDDGGGGDASSSVNALLDAYIESLVASDTEYDEEDKNNKNNDKAALEKTFRRPHQQQQSQSQPGTSTTTMESKLRRQQSQKKTAALLFTESISFQQAQARRGGQESYDSNDANGEDDDDDEEVQAAKDKEKKRTPKKQPKPISRKGSSSTSSSSSSPSDNNNATIDKSKLASAATLGLDDDDDDLQQRQGQEPLNDTTSDEDNGARPIHQASNDYDEDTFSPSVVSSSTPLPAIPNPLFRFMLHRGGRIGHVLIMVMVLWFEWLALYLPLVSHSLDWLYVHTIPKSIREPRRLAAGARRRGSSSSTTTTMTSLVNTASTTLARTGTSRRKRRELIRQADQKAVQQLQSLIMNAGSIKNARYQHVSPLFCQRHGLGQYRRGSPENQQQRQQQRHQQKADHFDHVTDLVDVPLQNADPSKGKALSKKKRGLSKSSRDGTNGDWVIQALTEDPQPARSSSSSSKGTRIRPTLSLAFGSGGRHEISLGLDFGPDTRDKYRQSVIEVVSSSSSSSQSKTSSSIRRRPREAGSGASDANSGIMGRIRAAAGSSVSRSLLGAYPGDAVPVSEAANAHGVIRLAERYGYSSNSNRRVSDENDNDYDGHYSAAKAKKSGFGGSSRIGVVLSSRDDNEEMPVQEARQRRTTLQKTVPRRTGSVADQLRATTGDHFGSRSSLMSSDSTISKTVPRRKGSLADDGRQNGGVTSSSSAARLNLSKTVPRRRGSVADQLLNGDLASSAAAGGKSTTRRDREVNGSNDE